MQPLVENLDHGMLANKLIQWVKINDGHTAFHKGKGTIDQIFLLRIIMAKYNKQPAPLIFQKLSMMYQGFYFLKLCSKWL